MAKTTLEHLKRKMTRDDLVELVRVCAEEDGVDLGDPQAVFRWMNQEVTPFVVTQLVESQKP